MPFFLYCTSPHSSLQAIVGIFFYSIVDKKLYKITIMIMNTIIETQPQPNRQPSSDPKPKVILL